MSDIHVITASAGTGKTTRLARYLEEAVTSAKSRPDAIVATTFSKKAAAELQERARQRLLLAGRVDDAHRLMAARIGTVNSVCGRLVEDFAFELGLAPKLRILDENVAQVVLMRALSSVVSSETEHELMRLRGVFPELEWPEKVRRIIESARANTISASALTKSAEQSWSGLSACLGVPGQSAKALDDGLGRAIKTFQDSVDTQVDDTKGTAKYLQDIGAALRRLERGALSWSEWAKLCKGPTTKKSAALAVPIQEAAAEHVRHPRLHADLKSAIDLLFTLAQRAMDVYEARKSSLGVIDFVDQEVYALKLLRMENVRAQLRDEIDLVLVDEFQDTSPIQLAIFLQLASLADQTVWVGDQKQAIYGFRGTDPKLMDSAIDDLYDALSDPGLVAAALECADVTKKPETLAKSWRSRPELVALTSDVFAPAFAQHGIAEERTRLVAGHTDEPAGLGSIVEYWPLEIPKLNRTSDLRPAVAAGVRQFLAREQKVRDPVTGQARVVRPGDIAVLCRTNAQCDQLAAALEALGIPAAIPRAGLLSTTEGRMTLAALRLWVDGRDRLAAGELSRVITYPDDPDAWLEAALSSSCLDEEPAASVIAARVPTAGVLAAFDQAIAAAGIVGHCQAWGNAEGRHANLDALRAMAVVYVDGCRAESEPATVTGLLAYLAECAEENQFLHKPATDEQALLADDDAVTVSTVHRAKGLEWPVTIMCGIETQRGPRVTGVHVASRVTSFDAGAPLLGRWVRYWPDPYRAMSAGPFRELVEAGEEFAELADQGRREMVRLLYVGWTRARDRLVLAVQAGKFLNGMLGELHGGGLALISEPTETPVTWAGREVAVHIAPAHPAEPKRREAVAGAAYPARAPGKFAAAFVSPSSLRRVARTGEPERLGEAMRPKGTPDMADLGQAVHGFFAADRQSPDRLAQAKGLLDRWRVGDALEPSDLLTMSDRLRGWVAKNFARASAHCEWPILHRTGDGSVLRGEADLVLIADDEIVVIDHKSFPGSLGDAVKKAAGFGGQLFAYGDALSAVYDGRPVRHFVHLPLVGVVVELTAS